MPTNDPILRLEDILENIARIRAYTEGMTETKFSADLKTIDAVERCLERIAEAARKLGEEFDTLYPDLDLPQLRGFGNVLRHDYDVIQPVLLWGFVQRRLSPLESMACSEIERLTSRG